jgi:protein involved in sex pheromone biosynthesis
MKWLGVMVSAALVAACASPQRDAAINSAQQDDNRCVDEQAQAIAPQKVDLETAVQGVLARCHSQIIGFERAMLAKYPGSETQMEAGLRRIREARADRARRAIALVRTQ